ncbi:XRE family transcriptional regulator [Larkinella soli]|uniref:XRE family transcriptional regulator n=1 Tax=Larkinella soli TaxID=1770527 RepID=UPI000FFC23F4|nr:LexA family transcriptional regulator [Larkinella soli]
MYIAENLSLLRSYYGLSLVEVGGVIGVTHPTLSKYEKGETVPPMDVAAKLVTLYKISLDILFFQPLGKLSRKQLQQMLASPDPLFRGQSFRVRELVSSVGPDNEENIELVPVKAAMGYCQGGFEDAGFIAELPSFRLPLPFISQNRKYRLFPAGGESMLPIPANAYVLGEYVQDWYGVKDGTGCVVVSHEGIVVKKVYNELATHRRLMLHSLNPAYQPYALPAEQLQELWRYVLYMSADFPDSEPTLSTILDELRKLNAGQEKLLQQAQ